MINNSICCLVILLLLLSVFVIITKINDYSFINKSKQSVFTSKTYYQMWYEIANQIVDEKSKISVSRYGDGEYLIMIGSAVEGIDSFGYKGGNYKIRDELYKALKCPTNANCYYGVWYNHLNEFMKWSNQHPKYFTTSNIFVNKNYPKTKLLFESIIHDENNDIILFCNEEAKNTSFAKIVLYFPKYIIEYYENNYNQIVKNVTSLAKKYNHHLFMLSIGPLAPVLIYHMRKANINNRYIDFGSTMDELIKGRTNRDYANPNTYNGKLIDNSFSIYDNQSIIFK